jgi:3-deoxy-D-manno-octulosonic-acid transferase
LSVGEVLSAIPLVKAVKERDPRVEIVFTVSTVKGMEVARDELSGKVGALLTMPIDFWWSMGRIVNHIRPSVFVLVETDLWPGLLARLRQRGTRCLLVNGRISPRTFRAYKRYKHFIRTIFQSLDVCLMQSDLDRERLVEAGVPPEKVHRIGNIKYDQDWRAMTPAERDRWLTLFRLGPDDMIWVAGSTHAGEEEILMRVHRKLKLRFPKLKLIIVPRRVEEAEAILAGAESMGLEAACRTRLEKRVAPYDLLVVDTLGELRRIYGLARVSFVGGSLVPFGGHNMLEPASFGCPVLFGPHTHNFADMSESLLDAGAGRRVEGERDLHEVAAALLEDDRERARMGKHAETFVRRNQGALGRVLSYIAADRHAAAPEGETGHALNGTY